MSPSPPIRAILAQMGDLVLGRLVRAVERGPDPGATPGSGSLPPGQALPWTTSARLDRALEGLTAAEAEAIGRRVVERDVRVGPYRFLRLELALETLDVIGPALFGAYLQTPPPAVRAGDGAVKFRWADPSPRGDAFWGLVDGMAKRLTELARVEVEAWTVDASDHVRTLRGELAPDPGGTLSSS